MTGKIYALPLLEFVSNLPLPTRSCLRIAYHDFFDFATICQLLFVNCHTLYIEDFGWWGHQPIKKQMPEQEKYIQDKTFNEADLPAKGEYENCIFNNCNFADSDLSEFMFIDCTFIGCNLSLAKLNRTAFRDVKFKDCKMLGLRFDTCNEFGLAFSFDGCQLNHSSFYKTKIRKTNFKNSQLQETDFSETDLTSAVFENCNLSQSIFDHSILEKADFCTSYNYSIDPEINRIKKAKFSISGISGLLDKYDIEIEK